MSCKTRASSPGGGGSFYARYLWDAFNQPQVLDRGWNKDTVYIIPLQIFHDVTVDKIIVVNTGANTGTRRAGIYADNGDTPVGGALLVESALVATAGTSRKQEIAIADTSLTAGLYWLAFNYSTQADTFLWYTNYAVAGGTLTGHEYGLAIASNLTNPCPATSGPAYCPMLGVRVVP